MTAENAEGIPDYAKIWMAIGKLTTGLEALKQLHASQAALIKSLVATRVQAGTNFRAQQQKVASLEQSRTTMLYRMRGLEDDLNKEWGRMKPAIEAVEALARLLPQTNQCSSAEICEYRVEP